MAEYNHLGRFALGVIHRSVVECPILENPYLSGKSTDRPAQEMPMGDRRWRLGKTNTSQSQDTHPLPQHLQMPALRTWEVGDVTGAPGPWHPHLVCDCSPSSPAPLQFSHLLYLHLGDSVVQGFPNPVTPRATFPILPYPQATWGNI